MAKWQASPGWLHYSSLLWRFLLIGVVSLSPLVGALVQFAGDEHDMALRHLRQQAQLVIANAVERQQHVLEEAQTMLTLLATAPALRDGGAACDRLLAEQLTLHRSRRDLRLSSADGGALCGQSATADDIRSSETGVIRRAAQERRFSVGELAADQTGSRPVVLAAAPVLDGERLVGVLSMTLDPNLFDNPALHQGGSSLDATMLVIDDAGRLVAHHPPLRSLVGQDVSQRILVRRALELRDGSAEVADLSGAQRLFVFRTLPATRNVLAVGLDREAVTGSINTALYYRLVLIALIISGSFLLGALGAEMLIFRPLRSLVGTAGSLAQGDFEARSSYTGSGEVGILARALNRMAEAVADRERALNTAKNVAEKALADARLANNAKTDFLASMSHEIRTPLNGIIGYTERLLDEGLPQPQRRYAELIQVAGTALLTVANDVLDFSSIEADQVALQKEAFSLKALINDTVSIVLAGSGRRTVPIHVEIDAHTPDRLVGDEARLRQILLNLLNNAVKFTKEGSITVRAEHRGSAPLGERVGLSVIDTGIGIPRDKHDRLFKRFSQVDRSIRREFGGTGLGLAISKRLVELMGGAIGVASEEGKGSTFWIEVTLPRAAERQQAEGQEPAGTLAGSARILLAEDIPINQELARSLLVAAGHRVDVVGDGDAAVRAVEQKTYDLVLMDVQMPGTDGITATKRIRTLPAPAGDVPIIAMTANVLPQQLRSFRDAGMNDAIGKPIKRAELFRKIGDWLPDLARVAGKDDDAVTADLCVNETEFQEFLAMMGPDQVRQWLQRLDSDLSEGFSGSADDPAGRRDLARQAHAVVSQAGLLGFAELAKLCTDLERACGRGTDVEAALGDVRHAAAKARATITRLMA